MELPIWAEWIVKRTLVHFNVDNMTTIADDFRHKSFEYWYENMDSLQI
jgi:hypothetical protein